MKNNDFQELVDQNLSGLVWDERKRQRMLHAVSKEEKPVRKISTTFILVAAIICISVTALAAGLMFSQKVDDMTLASQELERTYGVTPTMQGSYFGKTVEQGDNETIITFWGIEDLRYVLGEYTVVVKDGKAVAKWNHNGEDTSGGFDAEARPKRKQHRRQNHDQIRPVVTVIEHNLPPKTAHINSDLSNCLHYRICS